MQSMGMGSMKRRSESNNKPVLFNFKDLYLVLYTEVTWIIRLKISNSFNKVQVGHYFRILICSYE